MNQVRAGLSRRVLLGRVLPLALVGIGTAGCGQLFPRASVDVTGSPSGAAPAAGESSSATVSSAPAASSSAPSASVSASSTSSTSSSSPAPSSSPSASDASVSASTYTPPPTAKGGTGPQVPKGAQPTWSPSWSAAHKKAMQDLAAKAMKEFAGHKDSAAAWKKALWPMFTSEAKLAWKNVRPEHIKVKSIKGTPVQVIDKSNAHRGKVKFSTNAGVWVVELLATPKGWLVDSITSELPQ